MTDKSSPVRLFIGSSSEGKEVAAHLQDQLETRDICEVDLWDQVFEPSGYALQSLIAAAGRVDFAVLIATPDDTTVSRGEEKASVRDNVLLEFGLFAGALGLDRTYLLSTDKAVRLPSDAFGLTRLPYRQRTDGNVSAALNSAVLAVQRQVVALGPRRERQAARPGPVEVPPMVAPAPDEPAAPLSPSTNPRGMSSGGTLHEGRVLKKELRLLQENAKASGWVVRDTTTTLRIESPKGKSFVLSKGTASKTRVDLRPFADQLRRAGLRVNGALLRPPDESPFME